MFTETSSQGDATIGARLFEPVIDVKRRIGPYCGPTAIALLTGVPMSRIERMIRRKRGGYIDVNGRKIAVKGTYTWEITKILERLGCKVEKINGKWVHGETLNVVVKDCLPSTGTYLIEVTGHFMVASSGKIADTSHHEPIEIDSYRRKMRRVVKVWKVIAPEKPKWTTDHDQQVADRAAERKAKRDAAKPSIQVLRLQQIESRIKQWERKAKLAKTKLKKLYASRQRYQRIGIKL